MQSLSPSSRLVLAAVALALILAAVGGALQATPPTGSPLAAHATSAASATPSAGSLSQGESEPLSPLASPTIGSTPTSAPTPAPPIRTATPKPVACVATDQDQYVYHPDRLSVRAACLRVTGTVAAIRYEADGDLHILLAPDAPYAHLLTPANQGEELGDLVIEPVCVRPVTQADAIAICASDPDPMVGPFPVVGQRVWMEGRYVVDLQHGGWAELHPLYRWGPK